MSKPRSALAALVIVLSSFLLTGSHSLAATNDFTVTSFTTGLPSTTVIAVTQSRDGYLWLGTLNGLARSDGLKFTSFDESETPGLSSGPVSFLFGDSQGNLWVGTDIAGSKLIKNGVVRDLTIGSRGIEGRLVSAAETANGDIWLATADGRLYRYRTGSMDEWGPVLRTCRRMILEKPGILWLTGDHELLRLDTSAVQPGKALSFDPPFYFPSGVDYLLASHRGGFWMLANTNIYRYRAGRIEGPPLPYTWNPSEDVVLSATEDLNGNLIVGTWANGIIWFDAQGKAESLNSTNGLSHKTALSLHMDPEGTLWVGTDSGGLDRVKRPALKVMPQTAGKAIQSICSEQTNQMWIARSASGPARLSEGKIEEFGAAEGLQGLNLNREPNSSTVFLDRERQVWVGTRDFGLFKFIGDRFQHVQDARLSSARVNVTAIYEDRSGGMWVGTQNGLAHEKDGGWEFYSSTNGLAGSYVSSITDDAAANVWIGTESGLSRWREGAFRDIGEKDERLNVDISALLNDSSGALWVGTRGRGLVRFFDGKLLTLSTRQGLPSNRINYLAEDLEGGLWIGSSSGLIRIERSDLDEFIAEKVRSVRCRLFGGADGLPGECSSGSQPATWRAPDGTMWFTTTRGLVSVNPAHITRNTNPPPVMIESVLVDDVLQNTNLLVPNWPTTITIPPGKERLEIRYTSLNLSAPERARFRYQLEGHETGWTEAGREARFSNLSPDTYIFRVVACNEDGMWNDQDQGATLTVIVEPPFWKSWWFLTLSLLALLGIIVGMVHIISTQKLQRQLEVMRQQEALERERARIARDLHDQLGANLTQISLLGELAETDKDQPEEVEQHAKQISNTARSTAAALDEIVWAANPSNDTLDSLVTYACKYAQEYFALAGLTYRIEAPGKLPDTPVPPDVRHNVFLAFKESVNNVVKHAKATTAKVRVQHDAQQFVLEIEDDGRGVPPDATEKGRNGLRNMRKRMEDVGGEFTLGPAPERGTVVRLTAPLARKTAQAKA